MRIRNLNKLLISLYLMVLVTTALGMKELLVPSETAADRWGQEITLTHFFSSTHW